MNSISSSSLGGSVTLALRNMAYCAISGDMTSAVHNPCRNITLSSPLTLIKLLFDRDMSILDLYREKNFVFSGTRSLFVNLQKTLTGLVAAIFILYSADMIGLCNHLAWHACTLRGSTTARYTSSGRGHSFRCLSGLLYSKREKENAVLI